MDITGNQTVARAADIIIGKPLAILGLLLTGLVIRWVLHRLVDRLVAQADHGMLPVNRFSHRTSRGTPRSTSTVGPGTEPSNVQTREGGRSRW